MQASVPGEAVMESRPLVQDCGFGTQQLKYSLRNDGVFPQLHEVVPIINPLWKWMFLLNFLEFGIRVCLSCAIYFFS